MVIEIKILTANGRKLWGNFVRKSDQIRSVAQSCLTLCYPMNRSTPGLPVHHQLPQFTQTHVHRVSDATQPFHPLSSPSPPAPNPSQHQSLFQWVNSSHETPFQSNPTTGLCPTKQLLSFFKEFFWSLVDLQCCVFQVHSTVNQLYIYPLLF